MRRLEEADYEQCNSMPLGLGPGLEFLPLNHPHLLPPPSYPMEVHGFLESFPPPSHLTAQIEAEINAIPTLHQTHVHAHGVQEQILFLTEKILTLQRNMHSEQA